MTNEEMLDNLEGVICELTDEVQIQTLRRVQKSIKAGQVFKIIVKDLVWFDRNSSGEFIAESIEGRYKVCIGTNSWFVLLDDNHITKHYKSPYDAKQAGNDYHKDLILAQIEGVE